MTNSNPRKGQAKRVFEQKKKCIIFNPVDGLG
jgi:hypothetical protein